MADPIRLQFGEGAIPARSGRLKYADNINIVREINDGLVTIYSRPGTEEVLSISGSSTVHAMEAIDTTGPDNSVPYGEFVLSIVGTDVHKINANLTLSTPKLGTVASGGIKKIRYDGTHASIISGGKFYTYNVGSGTFAENTDAQIPVCHDLFFVDGFHYVVEEETGKIHTHSTAFAPEGGWAGDNATAEYAGDNIKGTAVDGHRAYLFGTRTTEIWEPDPDGSFPLRPIRGAYLDYGVVSGKTVLASNSNIKFLAATPHGSVFAARLSGKNIERVSTHDLEQEWYSYGANVGNAYSLSLYIAGHPLWVLVFPNEKAFMYDESISDPELAWSQIQFGSNPGLGQYRSSTVLLSTGTKAGISPLIGNTSGQILKFSWDFEHDLDGSGSPVAITTRTTSQEIRTIDNEYIDHPEVELYVHTGTTINTGTEDQIQLEYSDDHGNSWVSKSAIDTSGTSTTARIRYRGLGRSRDRIYRVTWNNDVDVTDYVRAILSGYIRRDGVKEASDLRETLRRELSAP